MGNANTVLLQNIATSTNGQYYYATATTGADDVLDLDTVYNKIQHETIDYTKDSNSDGLTDYYTDLILDGTLTLADGSAYLMIVPETSKDLADWDGDGLLNGEEIYVTTANGMTHVVMKSDPLLSDTDGDGYSDYEEVKQMKTSPTKTTWPLSGKNTSTTLRDLMNNDIFPEKYIELSTKESGMTHFVQDAASVFNFDFEKVEIPKKIFMKYFNDYAVGTMIAKDAEAVARQTRRQYWIDGLHMAGDVLKLSKTVINFTSDLSGGKYSQYFRDEAEQKQFGSRLENAMNLSKKSEQLMRHGVDVDLRALYADYMGVKDALEKHSAVRDGLKELHGMLADLNDISKDISDAKTGFAVADTIFKDLTAIATVAEQVAVVLDKFNKIELGAVGGFGKWGKKAMDFRKAHDTGISVGVTVALDLVDTSVKMFEIAHSYGQIQANYAEYYKNLGILKYIASNYSLSEYTREAANDLYQIFTTNNPDWEEFDRQIKAAYSKQIVASSFKMAVDVAIAVAGGPVVNAVKAVLDFLKSQFFDGYADVLFAAQVYNGLVAGSSENLKSLVKINSPYFSFDSANLSGVTSYARTLAQARIVGLHEVSEYIVSGNMFKKLWDFFGGFKEEKQTYQDAINRVYKFIDSCSFDVSPSLPK